MMLLDVRKSLYWPLHSLQFSSDYNKVALRDLHTHSCPVSLRNLNESKMKTLKEKNTVFLCEFTCRGQECVCLCVGERWNRGGGVVFDSLNKRSLSAALETISSWGDIYIKAVLCQHRLCVCVCENQLSLPWYVLGQASVSKSVRKSALIFKRHVPTQSDGQYVRRDLKGSVLAVFRSQTGQTWATEQSSKGQASFMFQRDQREQLASILHT